MGSFKETDHKRDKSGKFSSTGGGGSEGYSASSSFVDKMEQKDMSEKDKKAWDTAKDKLSKAKSQEEADKHLGSMSRVAYRYGENVSASDIRGGPPAKSAADPKKDEQTEKTTTPDAAQKLSTAEKSAVESYIGQDYSEINAALRGGVTPSKETEQRITEISAAIDKSTLSKDENVRRGLVLEPEEFAKYKSGASITDKAFMSTSRNGIEQTLSGVWSDYDTRQSEGRAGVPVVLDLQVPKGTKGLDVGRSLNIKDDYEQEVLLQKGTSYKIDKVTKREDGAYVVSGRVGNSVQRLQYTNRQPVAWRIDEDGLMRITMCVLKEGVYEYGSEEVPADPAFAGKDAIQELIPVSDFSSEAALLSLEGKPVIIESHEWRDADNTLQDGYTVGAVAGTPAVVGDELIVDALIYDAQTQDRIKSGQLVEVSAAYDGEILVDAGVYNGEHYDAKQSNFRFNHVLLLPEGKGRCGNDVRIINTKPEGVVMADKTSTLKVKIGNTQRTFRFSNEEDRAEAENMLEEQKAFNAEEVQAAIEAKGELEAQIEALKQQLAQHDEHLQAAKTEIERLLSTEVQEALATEAAEQTSDEDAIIEDEAEQALEGEIENEDAVEEEKEKITNSIRKGSFADRRRNAVALVFANNKREIPASWDQNAIDGAFEAIVLQARHRNSGRERRVLNGKMTPGTSARVSNSNRDRMLRPMQVRNAKKEDK